jgi:hypothetical protein
MRCTLTPLFAEPHGATISVGAGRVLMLNARPRSQQSWVCAPFAASAATAHAACKSVDPFGEDLALHGWAGRAWNGRILWLSLL